MTEAEWLACQDHFQLFKLYRSHPNLLKWRLASLACTQLLPVELQGAEIPIALTLVANVVEGNATFAEAELFLQRIAPDGLRYTHDGRLIDSWWVGIAWEIVDWVRPTHADPLAAGQTGFIDIFAAVAGAIADPDHINAVVRHTKILDLQNAHRAVSAQVCPILRDIFGNPFRTVTFSQSWRTDTVVTLAQQMYESRDFSAMPILADALQDAGCDNEDILSHCRGEGPHVRGCWVVDLVLGKS